MHRDDKFCTHCGAPLGPRLRDPETGDVLVEVEVHSVPDDAIALANERDPASVLTIAKKKAKGDGA